MKYLALLLPLLLGLCSLESPPDLLSYDEQKILVESKRLAFLKSYNDAASNQKAEVLTKAGAYLDSAICDILFPYWEGTTWDFNGHTDVPKQGEIACGYLVSTLLKHSGFSLNRYKMAQQSSLSEIKTLTTPKAPLYLGKDYETALEKLKTQPDGLYILGLSFHVGFIRKTNGKVNFLHSTFLTPTAVVNESAKESEAFMYSDVYYVGSISNNAPLIKKWLQSETIQIVMD